MLLGEENVGRGKDNGPPGIREHYHPSYYAAFVHDPESYFPNIDLSGDRLDRIQEIPRLVALTPPQSLETWAKEISTAWRRKGFASPYPEHGVLGVIK